MQILIPALLVFLSNQLLEMLWNSWWTFRAQKPQKNTKRDLTRTPWQFGFYFEFVSAWLRIAEFPRE